MENNLTSKKYKLIQGGVNTASNRDKNNTFWSNKDINTITNWRNPTEPEWQRVLDNNKQKPNKYYSIMNSYGDINKNWYSYLLININNRNFKAEIHILSPNNNIIDYICSKKYNYGIVILKIKDHKGGVQVEKNNDILLPDGPNDVMPYIPPHKQELYIPPHKRQLDKLVLQPIKQTRVLCNLLEQNIKKKTNYEDKIRNDYMYYYILCKYYVANHTTTKTNDDFLIYLHTVTLKLIFLDTCTYSQLF